MAKKEEKITELQDKDLKVKNFKEDIDKYIKEKIESETKKNVNIKDYKDTIDKYVKERVEIESASQSVKLLKKQLHNKKISSAIKTIIIFLLLCSIGYGVYYLYEDGYFDENKGVKCSNVLTDDKKDNKDNNKPDEPVIKETSLEDLTKEYGYLLDNVIFDANSNYTRDYYSGNLTNDIKLYLSFKLLDNNKIVKDDDSLYFEATELKKASSKLFGDISLETFKYNNVTLKYFEFKDVFVSSGSPNEDKVISREIIGIKVDDETKTVTITCVEGYINNDKLYNILSNKEVSGYKEGAKLSKYKDKLNTISYVFENEELVNLK